MCVCVCVCERERERESNMSGSDEDLDLKSVIQIESFGIRSDRPTPLDRALAGLTALQKITLGPIVLFGMFDLSDRLNSKNKHYRR